MKTRTVIRHREVEHVEGGVPRMIQEPYEVEVPVAPHDWDRIVFNGAMIAAISFTAVSVGWSAVSGGALLATTAPGWIAYPAAVAYDAAWITCMALEWLSRYDADRAQLPRRLGYLALLIAMGVICTHGVLTAGVAEGIAGSVISLIAKGLWALVLRHTSQALPYRTREWLKVSRAEIGAQLAIASQQRDLLRTQAQHAALVAATSDTAAPVALTAGPEPEPVPAPQASAPLAPAAPVRAAKPRRTPPPSTPAGPLGQAVDDLPALLSGPHAPIVYFIRNGSRVKIGTSQNLKRRLAALTLRPGDVLRAVHGDQRTERELHERYADQRAGNTEWFDLVGSLAEYLGVETQPAPDVSLDAADDAADTPEDANDAQPDAPQVSASLVLPAGMSKTARILATSSALQPGASPADIAHQLAQQGCAVDTAYVRVVLAREAKKARDDMKDGYA